MLYFAGSRRYNKFYRGTHKHYYIKLVELRHFLLKCLHEDRKVSGHLFVC